MANVVSSQSPVAVGLDEAKSAGRVPSEASVETLLVLDSETVPLRESIRVLYETCPMSCFGAWERTFQRGSSQHGNALRASIVSAPCQPVFGRDTDQTASASRCQPCRRATCSICAISSVAMKQRTLASTH